MRPITLPRPTPEPRGKGRRSTLTALVLAGVAVLLPTVADAQFAHSWLVFDAKTGEVLDKKDAHQAWYPASVTKLMTAYVTFQALRQGRIRMTSPVVQTAASSVQPPSKMGFPVGTVVTVDNALKIIMVKSANDVAWALGEAVSGSKDAFVDEMNRESRRLGMTGTVWGNPNGLPDASQYTNARDLAILARALIREFPEHAGYFKLPGIQFGKRVIRNHNHLMDRFPGTDGMKTGFICASGFNVVASVNRDGRRIVAVVLGSPNARSRAEKAAELFTRAYQSSAGLAGFFGGGGGSKETIDTMRPGPEARLPVENIRDEVCGRNRKPVGEDADEPLVAGPAPAQDDGQNGIIRPGEPGSVPARSARKPSAAGSYLVAKFDIGPAVKVWTGGADAVVPATTGDAAVAVAATTAPGAVPAPKPVETPQVSALVAERPAAAPGAIFPGQPKPAQPPELQPAPGSVTARAFGLFPGWGGEPAKPATGPGPGAGVADSLPPASGAPMVIAVAPPGDGTSRSVAAPPSPAPPASASAALPAADYPVPKAKPKAGAGRTAEAAAGRDDKRKPAPRRN